MIRSREVGQSRTEFLLALGLIGALGTAAVLWSAPGLQRQAEIANSSKYGIELDDHNGHTVLCYTNDRPSITEVIIPQQPNVVPQARRAEVKAIDVWCYNQHLLFNDRVGMGVPENNPIPQLDMVEESVTIFQQPKPEAPTPTQ